MKNKTRFCIFCGIDLENRTKEHVLGQWLIELTGDPKRNWTWISFGPAKLHKTYSLKEFTFPSCDNCNNEMSELEGYAKSSIQKLSQRSHITYEEALTLLDLTDKIRVGLWLGMVYLTGNQWNIDPSFYIKSRISKKDRFLAVYPCDCDKGMGIYGIEAPIFAFKPSCFAIRINNNLLFSLSDDFIFARNLCFPFPKETIFLDSEEKPRIKKMTQRKRIINPLPKLELSKPSIAICQSISSYDFFQYNKDHWEHLVQNSFLYQTIGKTVEGRLFDCLRNKFVLNDEMIHYGEISIREAQKYYKLIKSLYKLQLSDYKRNKDNRQNYSYELEKCSQTLIKKINKKGQSGVKQN